MKKILIILIALQLYSCGPNENYTYIPEDQQPILQDEDTVCYISNQNRIDSFVIYRRDYFHVSDKNYYQESINIRYLNLDIKPMFNNFFIQQKLNSRISVDGFYFAQTLTNENTIDLTVNNVVYHSVYFLHSEFLDTVPNTIYYSCKFGILRYEYTDGTYFELKNY